MPLTRERFTILWLVTDVAPLVGSVALLIGFVASVRLLGATATLLLAGFIGSLIVLPTAFIKGVVVPLTWGVSCPGCGLRPLRHVGCISFGHRFYQCQDCGLRCKRGGSSEPWYDASGSEDDAVYNPKAKGGPSPCSRWLPDRRDAGRIAGAVRAFILVFGCLFGCVAAGLGIERACHPVTIGLVLGMCLAAGLGREVGRPPAPNRNALWDGELDLEES
jgi:hypothetical protein